MPETTSNLPELHGLLPANSTTQTPVVSLQQSLSPLDIERVCRAFIQLLASSNKENQNEHKKASAEK
jgi:hypothetical protein